MLSSSVHTLWTIRYTSTMRTDINYSPSDVFLTLPRPQPTAELAELGEELDRVAAGADAGAVVGADYDLQPRA